MLFPSSRNGSLTVEFAPPDTLEVVYAGVVDGPCVLASRDASLPLVSGLPYYLLIFDVRQLESVTHSGRRAIVARPPGNTPPIRAIAVIGASFHTRALMSMLARAWHLLHGVDERPVRFFDSAEEARTWFVERRKDLAGK